MSDIFFILKSFFLTGLVVTLLQVKVGDWTVENHALVWIKISPITRSLQKVASGGVMVMSDLWLSVTGKVEFFNKVKFKSSSIKNRLQIQRSEAGRSESEGNINTRGSDSLQDSTGKQNSNLGTEDGIHEEPSRSPTWE